MAEILATPGPVPVPPQALEVLGEPVIHHRTPEFKKVFAEVLSDLQQVAQTASPVLVHSASGTGAMESVLVNLHSPGDKVLCLPAGKFGERWVELAEAYGLEPLVLSAPWGQSPAPEQVAQLLKKHPEIKSVLVQACETSTGQSHPIRDYAQITSPTDTLLLVDAISALGAYELPMDDWKIDALVGGSQKAFMAPAGLSFVALSERAWQAQKKATLPRYYFDLAEELSANSQGQTRFSSPVSLLKALHASLKVLLGKGLSQHWDLVRQRKNLAAEFLNVLGLEQLPENPAPSLTVVKLPEGIDGEKLQKAIQENHHVVFMGGQGELKGRVLRWSHIGHYSWKDQITIARSLALGLKEAGADLPPSWTGWLQSQSEQRT